jgi:hypothetical protein
MPGIVASGPRMAGSASEPTDDPRGCQLDFSAIAMPCGCSSMVEQQLPELRERPKSAIFPVSFFQYRLLFCGLLEALAD